jgi:hypothetical protein
MKKFTLVIVLFFVFSFVTPLFTLAATSPSLGTASTFGVLGSTFTNTTGGTVNGNVGYTTPPAVMPIVNGATHVADASYNQAGLDQNNALNTLNAQSCDFNFNSPTDLSLLPQPLAPGVYCITAAASVGTGGITLNGAGTYIFRINGAFTTVANSNISTSGGASACNVFWAPTSATTLGANSTFTGTIIDPSGITVGSTVNLNGAALAFGGTVTTNADTISVPSCGAPVVTPVITTVLIPPSISVTKTPTLLSQSALGGLVAFDYAVSNTGTIAMSNITISDDKCSPVVYVSGDTNLNSQLDISEIWRYRCTSNISQTTTNTATVTGQANGYTARGTANTTVTVNAPAIVTPPPAAPVMVVPVVVPSVVPSLPKTGFAPLNEYEFFKNLLQIFTAHY